MVQILWCFLVCFGDVFLSSLLCSSGLYSYMLPVLSARMKMSGEDFIFLLSFLSFLSNSSVFSLNFMFLTMSIRFFLEVFHFFTLWWAFSCLKSICSIFSFCVPILIVLVQVEVCFPSHSLYDTFYLLN